MGEGCVYKAVEGQGCIKAGAHQIVGAIHSLNPIICNKKGSSQ